MRSDDWLYTRLDYIWSRYFEDIERITPIRIQFGRRAYRRLGSIGLRKAVAGGAHVEFSQIIISSLLADDDVPEIIIDQVLAHEIVHYVHGFGSHHPRTLKHPHQGGVIISEFRKRGLWELYRAYTAWMKIYWPKMIQGEF